MTPALAAALGGIVGGAVFKRNLWGVLSVWSRVLLRGARRVRLSPSRKLGCSLGAHADRNPHGREMSRIERLYQGRGDQGCRRGPPGGRHRRGWGGLAYTDPDNPVTSTANLIPLDPGVVRTIDRTGGTFLHTSRTNPARMKPQEVPAFLEIGDSSATTVDTTAHVLRVLENEKIDVLVPIGGDDALLRVATPRGRVPVIAIPKTMDNDVHGPTTASAFQPRSAAGSVHPQSANGRRLARANRGGRVVR